MKITLLAFLLAGLLQAQQKQPVSSLQEDCSVNFAFTVASSGTSAAVNSPGTTPVIDNRQAGCLDWIVAYATTTTVTGISLLFQTATDVAGVPTTWSNYGGTLNSGINPNTAVTAGGAVTDATGKKYPFLRMNLTSLTGTGTVTGKLYGWKRRPTYVNISSGGGCPGTVATPCVVIGPAANGAFANPHPVVIGGILGGTQVTSFGVDANGGILPASNNTGGASDGITNVNVNPPLASAGGNLFNLAIPYNFNGTTYDRTFYCTNRATIALTTIGLTRIITGISAKKIRLCSLSMSFASPVDIQVVEGTKVTTDCDTGATNMSGLYRSVVGFDPNLSNLFALTEATNADDVCISMSASVNGGGTAIYAVF